MASRLQQLRATLSNRQVDLQRTYNFRFQSMKLGLFDINTQIISINHPYFQFTNEGEYRGLITKVVKPGDLTITFLEDDKQTVNSVIEIWEGLKFNKARGIHYPKAAYEDQALLIYTGNLSSYDPNALTKGFGAESIANDVGNSLTNFATDINSFIRTTAQPPADDSGITAAIARKQTMKYALTGLYPINRETVQLGYDQSDVVRLTVTFNVDDITPLFIYGGIGL